MKAEGDEMAEKEQAANGDRTAARNELGQFVPGEPGGPGRPKGVGNKATEVLKAAIVEGLNRAGGEGGAAGWWAKFANDFPESFANIVSRLIPQEKVVGATVLNTSDPDHVPVEVSDMFFTLLHQVEIEAKLEAERESMALEAKRQEAAKLTAPRPLDE